MFEIPIPWRDFGFDGPAFASSEDDAVCIAIALKAMRAMYLEDVADQADMN